MIHSSRLIRHGPCNTFVATIVTILLHIVSTQAQSIHYNFSGCKGGMETIFGASVSSQKDVFYTESSLHCITTFQVPDPEMGFLVQLESLDLPDPEENHCSDSISLLQTHPDTTEDTMILDPRCGSLLNGSNRYWYTDPGFHIKFIWKTGATVSGKHKGFKIILTSIISSPKGCSANQFASCSKTGDCISSLLRCDHVDNCIDKSDEHDCTYSPDYIAGARTASETDLNHSTHNKTTMLIQTTTKTPTVPSDEDEIFQEVDMVSIIVVGVLFVVILMICVILACRSKGGDLEVLTEESNQLRLDISGNAGYSEGGEGLPATPPPTYSMIERQTSYVSQISMSSSQVSFPPDYDEALEIDSHGNVLPRRNSTMSSRNSSTPSRNSSILSGGRAPVRSASGYRSRPRTSRYSRSHSTTETPRPRYQSQTSAMSEVIPIDENSMLDTEELFYANITETTPEPTDTTPAVPVTSTPFNRQSDFHIETSRDDSQAPLFTLVSSSVSSEASTSHHDNTDGEAPILDHSNRFKDGTTEDHRDPL